MRLIDLDAAIDAITRIKIKDVYDEKHAKGITVGLLSAIDELERLPAVNRWIPVTEGLPEENARYLVTNSQWGYFEISINAWIDGEWLFPEEDPIAWMPLPEPWEEEE